jgi:hypothetical protein
MELLRLREDTREVWGRTWLDRLRQDLTYGARVLRNAPGFTLTAMLVLVFGIGIPLSAFRVVLTDLQGGSVPDPDSLVHLTRRAPDAHITSVTYPELAFYAANATSFRSLIGISGRNAALFSEAAAGSTPEPIHVAFATFNYFPEFGDPDAVRDQCVRSASIREGDGVFCGGDRNVDPATRAARDQYQPC